jgi:hypothetical protein
MGDDMSPWKEPGSIEYQRRTGGDKILEAEGVRPKHGGRPFIMVCGMGTRTVWIRWYARSVEEARDTFRNWLAQPWQVLTTDFSGMGVPNGMDFKPGRIDWFNIAGD